MHKPVLLTLSLALAIMVSTPACFNVKYSMSGASIHPNVKTVSVQYFQNRAPIVNPSLSQVLTNKLKEKIESQTSLILVNGTGDVDFQGSVTDYSTSPTSITGDQIAAENIFKISVKVKFNNMVDPSTNYEASFSKNTKVPQHRRLCASRSPIYRRNCSPLGRRYF
ncbi:MAG: LptE family protein [Bacteroidales bacterium]|nr:LptE family protein [Bacteroidales bacterium]